MSQNHNLQSFLLLVVLQNPKNGWWFYLVIKQSTTSHLKKLEPADVRHFAFINDLVPFAWLFNETS